MKRTTFIIAFFLSFSITANAQFFKKLGDKVIHTAEKTVSRKAEQKTKKETEKAFDSTFNKKIKKDKKNRTTTTISNVDQVNSYAFNYKAVMHMISGEEEINFDYYLSNTSDYFGMAIKDKRMQGDFIMVYDLERETMITFMENAGQKMKVSVNYKKDNAEDNSPKFVIKATGNSKKISGYNCKEYEMTGENMTATVWVTKDINIRFPSTLYGKDKSNNHEWMKNIDGWAMQMEMVDTSQRKPQTITMHCLSIEEKTYKINTNEYQNIGR